MSETFQIDNNRLFRNLEEALKNDLASISVEANGGRSILFVYNMEDDDEYINEGRKRLPEDKFHFIDMRETFSDYIKSIGGEKVFNEMYANFGKEVYRSENNAEDTFFEYLMNTISSVFEAGKSPVLVHTGTIYDMGFSNINIMEDARVLRARLPLIVFYPATIEGETIKFLGKEIASRYRCIVVK